MKRKRHKVRRRHNPIGTKIAMAVGLTAAVAGLIGAAVYFSKKPNVLAVIPPVNDPTKTPTVPPTSGDTNATPPPKDEPPVQVATQTVARGEPYQPGLHHGLDAEGNY